jgi:hypothetical protein
MDVGLMTKYFGVIVDLISRTTESIEGEYPFKPAIEEGGLFCSCHWYQSEEKALLFEIWCLKTFRNMVASGEKGLV